MKKTMEMKKKNLILSYRMEIPLSFHNPMKSWVLQKKKNIYILNKQRLKNILL